MKKILALALACALLAGCTTKQPQYKTETTVPTYKVVLASDVEWTHLNPKRGDLAPKAGTLWGDRNSIGPTGFLLKPSDGFQSPPHIHNVSYRGVVIDGVIHNDDPKAENMWMPTGSFWTQPKGEVHITCAKGISTLAYIEIEEGPYLVHPAEDAFHTNERPVNIDNTNIVWLDASNVKWIDQPGTPASNNGPKVAFLWGKPEGNELRGNLVKLPAGFIGTIKTQSSTFGAVVVKGQPQHNIPGDGKVSILETGSYFSSTGNAVHNISTNAKQEAIFYVRADGKFKIIQE